MSEVRSGLLFYVLKARWGLSRRDAIATESDYSKPKPAREYPVYLLPESRTRANAIGKEIADIWARSIFLTKTIADSMGAGFIAVLQPNQYYGTRVFSEEEKRVAFSDPPWYGAGSVPPAYDAMRSYAPEFQRRGVTFVDATAAFDNEPGLLYIDSCCHFNSRGMTIVQSLLAEPIRRILKRSP
jgi:hypothetical protein